MNRFSNIFNFFDLNFFLFKFKKKKIFNFCILINCFQLFCIRCALLSVYDVLKNLQINVLSKCWPCAKKKDHKNVANCQFSKAGELLVFPLMFKHSFLGFACTVCAQSVNAFVFITLVFSFVGGVEIQKQQQLIFYFWAGN